MDFWGAVRVLRRRWYVAVPSVVIAVGLAFGVFLSIPTTYGSTGVMLLTTPSSGPSFSEKTTPEDAIKINPLLAFDGSLSTTSQILAQILGDPKTREQLGVKEGSPDTFTAAGGGQNGPFLFVTGDSSTPERAEAMVATVLERAHKELDESQRKLNAPQSTFITSQVIVNPTKAEAKIGGKVRYGGAALVLLLLLTMVVTFATDSITENLKRRKSAKTDSPEPESVLRQQQPITPPTNGVTPRPPQRPQSAPRHAQPSASEKTVRIPVPKPGPTWPTHED